MIPLEAMGLKIDFIDKGPEVSPVIRTGFDLKKI